MNGENGKVGIKDFFAFILFLALIAVPIYFAYTILLPRVVIFDTEEDQQENSQDDEQEDEDIDVYDNPHYEEILENIEGEMAYIVAPRRLKGKEPSTIVVYSHGSITNVTENMDDVFMQELRGYGIMFTKNNFIFAASNQHGANWGNELSIQDTLNMINWIQDNYDTKEKVYMIGFSMGGLPTLNFATRYPELVSKVALLAPTTRANEWDSERVSKIENMNIQIWHGTADVNVPYSLSTTFVNRLGTLGRDISLITLEGKTHWDMESNYMDDILEYFLNN
jgi:predicted peptidase